VTSVDSITKFDGYHPNYRHLTMNVDLNGFCPASCVIEMVHQMTHCQFVLHEKVRKCIPKTTWAS